MSNVKNIIRITPAEREENRSDAEITQEGKRQLDELIKILQIDKPLVGRAGKSLTKEDQIIYVLNKSPHTSKNSGELLRNNLLDNPTDREEITQSTKEGGTIVVGVSQKELREIINMFTQAGYKDVVSPDMIDRPYNIYALNLNRENSSYELFESIRGGITQQISPKK